MEDNLEQQRFAVDFGDGRRIDVEIPNPELVWAVLGPGIQIADVWMHGVGDAVDLRVRIQRSDTTLEVSVDRGEQSNAWWPHGTGPRLLIRLDPGRSLASATAAIGDAAAERRTDLGTTAI